MFIKQIRSIFWGVQNVCLTLVAAILNLCQSYIWHHPDKNKVGLSSKAYVMYLQGI